MSAPDDDRLARELDHLRARITELEREQDALREDEARLTMMVEQLPAILWTTDTQLRFTSSMGAGLSGLNLRPGEVVGLTLFEYFKTDDPQFPPIAAIRRALAGHSENFEQEWTDNVYQVYVEPLRRRDTIIGTLGVALDITPRKHAEQDLLRARDQLEQAVAERTRELRTANRILREDMAKHEQMEQSLRESERRFRIIAETIPVPVVITRIADGQILYANPRAGEALNIPHERLVGQPSTNFYRDPQVREQLLQLLAREGQVTDFEVQAQRPDGLLRWVSVSLQPLSFQEQSCVLASIVDVTRRGRFTSPQRAGCARAGAAVNSETCA